MRTCQSEFGHGDSRRATIHARVNAWPLKWQRRQRPDYNRGIAWLLRPMKRLHCSLHPLYLHQHTNSLIFSFVPHACSLWNYTRDCLAAETPEEREAHLQQMRYCLTDETPEKGQLQQMRDCLAAKTPEREARLQQMMPEERSSCLAAVMPEERPSCNRCAQC